LKQGEYNMKISIIGAGSIRFSLQLIGDMAKTKSTSDSHVSIMDINEEKLNAIYLLAQKYANELNSGLRFEKTTDLSLALDSADFVINTAAPCLYPDHYEKINQVGEKHGYYRGIDSREFNMVSTYNYALCSYYDLKFTLNLAQSMEKLCPNAWLLQTANPVFEITQVVSKLTNTNIVGFCHGFSGVFEVFRSLKLNPKEVDWQVAGVNHGIWLNRFLYQGKNAYPMLDRWIEEESQSWEPKNPWDVQFSPAVIDMYKFYGLLPIGDTCRNGTWKYNFNLNTKKNWYGKFGGIDNEIERPKFHQELFDKKQKLFELAKMVEGDPQLNLTQVYPEIFMKEKMSGEQHIPFINAINKNCDTRLILNAQNFGAIPNIPDDVVVEIPIVVNQKGFTREKLEPDLTDRIKTMYLMPRVLQMKSALEAFSSKDKKVLEEILIRDARTSSYEQVKAVLDEIMSLPFNREIAEYFSYQV
jgi:alpha-galactosidase/6-phospho-beta-glucosidase family protein